MRTEITDGRIICCDPSNKEYANGYIVVENDRILDIGKGPLPCHEPGARLIEAGGKIILPGFVNGHTHSYANITRGLTPTVPLEIWMVYAVAASQVLAPRDIYLSALLGGMEMIRTGTTACVDHFHASVGEEAMEQVSKAYTDIGIRAFIAPMVSDRPYPDSLPLNREEKLQSERIGWAETPSRKELLGLVENGLRKWRDPDGLVRAIVGYSAPHRCSDDFVVSLHDLAGRYDVGIHTHLLETRFQSLMGQELYGEDIVSHLSALGVLDKRVAFAHGVWVSREGAERLASAGCTIVHNPQSNLSLGSGVCPIPMLQKAGVNVALGTDGSNCGGTQSMFRSLHLGATQHNHREAEYENWPTVQEALGWATRGGARSVLAAAEIGSLEKGKKADLVIIDTSGLALTPLHNSVDQLVLGEPGVAVESVMVNGKWVLEKRVMTSIAEGDVLHEIRERAPCIKEKYQEMIGRSIKRIDLVKSMYQRLAKGR